MKDDHKDKAVEKVARTFLVDGEEVLITLFIPKMLHDKQTFFEPMIEAACFQRWGLGRLTHVELNGYSYHIYTKEEREQKRQERKNKSNYEWVNDTAKELEKKDG